MIKILFILVLFIIFMVIKGLFHTSKNIIQGGHALLKGYQEGPQLKENRRKWLDSYRLEEEVSDLGGWFALSEICDDIQLFTAFIKDYKEFFLLSSSDLEQANRFYLEPQALHLFIKEGLEGKKMVVKGQDVTDIYLRFKFISAYLGIRDALANIPYHSINNLHHLLIFGPQFSYNHLITPFQKTTEP